MEDDNYPLIQVVDAPGYDDFEGELMFTTPAVDYRGELGIVGQWDLDGLADLHVIPMKHVKGI